MQTVTYQPDTNDLVIRNHATEPGRIYGLNDIMFDPARVEGYREPIERYEVERALGLLCGILSESEFMEPGWRNDQAVNISIALHVLGFNPSKWLEIFLNKTPFGYNTNDWEIFQDHLNRIEEYLFFWGPQGLEEQAFDFCVEYK